jgi:hypothetical protein
VPRARRDSKAARAGIEKLEEMLGFSPDPARGIKEGQGLLGQLSTLIEQNGRKERRSAELRRLLAVVAVVVGILGGLVTAAKTLIDLHH